jgi:hypothetical protein
MTTNETNTAKTEKRGLGLLVSFLIATAIIIPHMTLASEHFGADAPAAMSEHAEGNAVPVDGSPAKEGDGDEVGDAGSETSVGTSDPNPPPAASETSEKEQDSLHGSGPAGSSGSSEAVSEAGSTAEAETAGDETMMPSLMGELESRGISPMAATTVIDLSTVSGNGAGYTLDTGSSHLRLTLTGGDGVDSYVIIQTTATSKVDSIIADSGVIATVTIEEIHVTDSINAADTSAFKLKAGADITLLLKGESSLRTANTSASNGNAGFSAPQGTTLAIKDSGEGNGGLSATAETIGGAGIGGSFWEAGGNISIQSGAVTAAGGKNGAGIGGGSGGESGEIIISGGDVDALGGEYGAGIGGGAGAYGGKISIGGGTVYARGGYNGAGLGGGGHDSYGNGGDGGEITINGGTVIAAGRERGAGIGGGGSVSGKGGRGGKIAISGDASVTADGGVNAAGIGGGNGDGYGKGGSGGEVTISGNATVMRAKGGMSSAGIGGSGIGASGGTITISGGTVQMAQGGYYGAGIGGGDGGPGGNITVSGGTVELAEGGRYAAGIGGGYGGSGGTIIISGNATVMKAQGTYGGAGIGGGSIGSPATLAVGKDVSIHAYSVGGDRPAIHAESTTNTEGYFVNAYFGDTTRGVTLKAFRAGDEAETIVLPAGYGGFAYTTGTTAPTIDVIKIYDSSSKFLGTVVQHSSGTPSPNSEQIPSVNTGAVLPVRLKIPDTPVTISNMSAGDFADRGKAFTYTVTLKNASGAVLTGTCAYEGGIVADSGAVKPSDGALVLTGGSATFVLTHGQSITLSGLTSGDKVRIAQADEEPLYLTSYTDSLSPGTKVAGLNIGERALTSAARTFAFTNQHHVTVPAGVDDGNTGDFLIFPLFGLLALLFIALYTLRRRRVDVGTAIPCGSGVGMPITNGAGIGMPAPQSTVAEAAVSPDMPQGMDLGGGQA